MSRRRALSAAAALAACALAIPGVADAVVATISPPLDPTAVASCPGTATTPCAVVSRTTAMQVVVGHAYHPLQITVAGRIVGWQVTLSAPTTAQIKYFDTTEGGASQAAIAVLRPVRALDYRLVAIGPLMHLQPYFGQTVSFPLVSTIAVAPGDMLALAVPTWAPALQLHAGHRTAWRASRSRSQCTNVAAGTAQTTPGGVMQYACIYQSGLVTFNAVEISTP